MVETWLPILVVVGGLVFVWWYAKQPSKLSKVANNLPGFIALVPVGRYLTGLSTCDYAVDDVT